jgi:hypothetical protein
LRDQQLTNSCGQGAERGFDARLRQQWSGRGAPALDQTMAYDRDHLALQPDLEVRLDSYI